MKPENNTKNTAGSDCQERLVRLRGTPNQLADLWEKSAKEFSDEVGDDVSLRGTTNRAYAQCLKTCAEQIRDYCGEISAAAKSCEWCEHGKSIAIQSGSPVACMIHEKLFSASHTCDRWEILQTNA
jgi:hypothetical protein